jgi:hypothetical protein
LQQSSRGGGEQDEAAERAGREGEHERDDEANGQDGKTQTHLEDDTPMELTKPTLIDNWGAVLTKAWSLRWWALSTLLMLGELVLPAIPGVPPKTALVLATLAAVCGMAARLLTQLGLTNTEDDHGADT